MIDRDRYAKAIELLRETSEMCHSELNLHGQVTAPIEDIDVFLEEER